MRYALLDWDNTVRHGYALFSWINYLVDSHYFDIDALHQIDESIDRYKKGVFTHDDLSKKAAEICAFFLKGKKSSDIVKYLEEYLTFDESLFFSFTKDLFDLLDRNDIKPIIISGSPKVIIENYSRQFNLFRIYAFEPEEHRGIYTGRISCNYGFSKDKFVKTICKELGTNPILAFGDAESDIPMLKAAKYGFLIGHNNDDAKSETEFHFLSIDENAKTVIMLVNSAINNL